MTAILDIATAWKLCLEPASKSGKVCVWISVLMLMHVFC